MSDRAESLELLRRIAEGIERIDAHLAAADPAAPRSTPAGAFPVVCSECGAATTVTFKPRSGRPVICNDCYRARPRS